MGVCWITYAFGRLSARDREHPDKERDNLRAEMECSPLAASGQTRCCGSGEKRHVARG